VKTAPCLVNSLAAVVLVGGVGCTLDSDSLAAADLEARIAALEQQIAQQAQITTKLRITAGGAAALAMCKANETNPTTDPQYVAAGSTGDATCTAFRAESNCRETHLVYAYDDGSAEGSSVGPSGCAVPAEYSNPNLVGYWACCNR